MAVRGGSHSPAITKNGTIFIEARLNSNNSLGVDTEVHEWLRRYFLHFQIGQTLDMEAGELRCRPLIESIRVAGHSHLYPDGTILALADNNLHINAYSLHDDECDELEFDHNEDVDSAQFTVLQLPHQTIDGYWESLTFEERTPELVLRLLIRKIQLTGMPGLDPALVFQHNVILFHGPPGSGKTTMANGIAQKLSIRLSQVYPTTKLLIINSHALLGQYFSESGKLVSKLFETLWSISADDNTLLITLIDEIESIVSSRETANRRGEPIDAVRATNEFLRGLDWLRQRPNAIFICTSNLKDTLDSAFLDRCTLKKKVDSPSVNAMYEILRRDINTLITHNLVHYNSLELCEVVSEEVSRPIIPDAAWVEKHLYDKPNAAPRELVSKEALSYFSKSLYICRIAELAKDLSGRNIRRLSMLALTQYTVDQPCDIGEFLIALKRVIREEKGLEEEPAQQTPEISSTCSDLDDLDIAVTADGALSLEDPVSNVPIR